MIEMKKLWVEEHLGVKLNWYQRIWFWPQDRDMRRRYKDLLHFLDKTEKEGVDEYNGEDFRISSHRQA